MRRKQPEGRSEEEGSEGKTGRAGEVRWGRAKKWETVSMQGDVMKIHSKKKKKRKKEWAVVMVAVGGGVG